jgi:hypothetical protein
MVVTYVLTGLPDLLEFSLQRVLQFSLRTSLET